MKTNEFQGASIWNCILELLLELSGTSFGTAVPRSFLSENGQNVVPELSSKKSSTVPQKVPQTILVNLSDWIGLDWIGLDWIGLD